jgi:hypothetical protein
MGLLSLRRRIPWLLVFEGARMAHGHLMSVTSPQDRHKLTEMLRRTKGDFRHLTDRDKADLKRIGAQLDLGGFVREAGPRMVFGRGRRR